MIWQIFQLTSYCGCPNECLPPTYPTKKEPNSSKQTASSQREGKFITWNEILLFAVNENLVHWRSEKSWNPVISCKYGFGLK